jgi:hypothetical protein
MQKSGLIAVVLAFGLTGPLAAAPIAEEKEISGADISCTEARATLDNDRGRMEALMLSMSDEDQKPESPSRFKRMCAIDSEISVTAARLAKVINAAPDTCLSTEDREAATELKRLSSPIPECRAPIAGKTAPDRKVVVASKQPATRGLKRSAKAPLPAAPAGKSKQALPLVAPGLMSDLY